MAVLGMDRQTALDGVDEAEVAEMQWAHWERQTGKTARWCGKGKLERITEILSEWAKRDGTRTQNDTQH